MDTEIEVRKMECKEIRVDVRTASIKESTEGQRQTKILFQINHTMPFTDEYNPLRRKLLIEVSKDELPVADVLYSFDKVEVSKVKKNELTVGVYKAPYYDGDSKPAGYINQYIAEFIIDNVGYRIISENLSQEEFIKVLISMPVFE